MVQNFHHGARVAESTEVPVLIRPAESATIAILGVAPDADASAFPLNTPVLLKGSADATKAELLGEAGTLKDAVLAIWAQIGAYVYVVRVEDSETPSTVLTNLIGSPTTLTGVHAIKKIEQTWGRKLKPRMLVAPGFATTLATAGLTAANVTAPGSGYAEAPAVTVTPEDGNTPTVAAAAVAVMGTGADADKVVDIVFTQPGEGYTDAGAGPTLTIADPADGVTATATVSVGTVGNPLVYAAIPLLEEGRAVMFVDGPATTDAAAAQTAALFGSDRIYVVDPGGEVWDADLGAYVSTPLSAHFAGVQAKTDLTIGFAASVSNKPINGVDRPSRPIAYGAQTNALNLAKVGTIVNFGDGLRTWGNRTTAATSIWAFLNVRRTADLINDAIEGAMMEFVDKRPTQANLRFMLESVRAFLATQKAEGTIINFQAWIDPEKNSAADAASGRWTISLKYEPYAPMEDLRFIAHREIKYYAELIDNVARAIEDGALALPAA